MALQNLDELLSQFNCNAPATIDQLDAFEASAQMRLPGEYREFLLRSNGGEGFIGPSAYAILWRVEELRLLNDGYEVEINAPGLFVFGSDGGGEAFAFDLKGEGSPIVAVPFVGMERKAAWTLAPTFQLFLERLYRTEP
jgi:hypothetical protein